MPTLAKALLIEPESPWGAPSEKMYQELCRDRRRILTALGFYPKRDLPSPEEDSEGVPTIDEERELLPIAGALTAAAEESTVMPTAVLVASLLKVSKKPSLFFTRGLPQPVEWALAGDYQRGEEPPATHWRDVWGDQVARFPGEVEKPTEANIAKAAARCDRNHSRIPEGPAALPMVLIKFFQTDWAKFFAAVASRFAGVMSRSCATARSYTLKEVAPSTIFLSSF